MVTRQPHLGAAGNQAFNLGSDEQILLSLQDLELHKQDHDNSLWVAEATELTAVDVVKCSDLQASTSIKQLSTWLDRPDQFMQRLQARVRPLAT